MNIENYTFDNFNPKTGEGKLLLAALSILTQSDFNYYGKIIEGSKKTPHEIFSMVVILASDNTK